MYSLLPGLSNCPTQGKYRTYCWIIDAINWSYISLVTFLLSQNDIPHFFLPTLALEVSRYFEASGGPFWMASYDQQNMLNIFKATETSNNISSLVHLPLQWSQNPGPVRGTGTWRVNTLRPRQNGRHFADDILKWILLNQNIWILIDISLKFIPKGQINNTPALVQIMASRRPSDKPLFELMVVSLSTHICVTLPQWVNYGIW